MGGPDPGEGMLRHAQARAGAEVARVMRPGAYWAAWWNRAALPDADVAGPLLFARGQVAAGFGAEDQVVDVGAQPPVLLQQAGALLRPDLGHLEQVEPDVGQHAGHTGHEFSRAGQTAKSRVRKR